MTPLYATRSTPLSDAYQRGAAMLLAMLLVTLVAVLSAAAVWHQWRGVAVESAERQRLQASWILQGAIDWARLILREDARAGSTDHLAEPWAVPLKEARLSSFLASAQGHTDTVEDLPDAFLSGYMVDLQGRMNVRNLVGDDGKPQPIWVRSFTRLFTALNLPENELASLLDNLSRAVAATPDAAATSPLTPNSLDQLLWLGMRPDTLATLRPYITYLPERTPININTAPVQVLAACADGVDEGQAQRLLSARAQSHFRTLSDATQALGRTESPFTDGQHSVGTHYFEVTAQLRADNTVVQERVLIRRDGLNVRVLQRERVPASVQ